MKNYKARYLFLLMILSACSTKTTSPGMTLLTGLNGYHDEMEELEGQAARWPERQRVGNTIRTTYLTTMGGSKEFNRLVELDLKRREYRIALRTNSLRPDRAAEVKQELVEIDAEIAALGTLVKRQVAARSMPEPEPQPQQVIEGVATIGLLTMAIDEFSPSLPRYVAVPSVQVGGYTVIDQQNVTIVKTPAGQTFQCTTVLVQEEGAGITCAERGGR
ncbi:MAG TPA: hypothetical protein VMR88_00605 [Candidatus Polarisedimenticolaceae bacterium]|nr:hypothetical protein [Candidatus Polarisedimenticolaceae bacterium]